MAKTISRLDSTLEREYERSVVTELPLSGSTGQLIQVAEWAVEKGKWQLPASPKVSIALSLRDVSSKWRATHGLHSEDVVAGNVSICRVDEERWFEFKSDTAFGIVSLEPEAFSAAVQDLAVTSVDLRPNDVIEDATLRDLTMILLQEQRNRFQNGLLFLDSVTSALTTYLVNKYSAILPVMRLQKGGLARSALRRCIEYIDANLHRDIRLEDLGRESGVSPSHLIRSFRESTGKTPHQFVLQRRIDRAKSLMSDRRLGLTEVALASGFSNQHHLSRVFRKVTGMTPSHFRLSLS
jgi:AraC family transcriptional regulator